MVVSQARFRGNETTTLSANQLRGIERSRTSIPGRLELIERTFPDNDNGILRPFRPDCVAIFRASDADAPLYRFGQIEAKVGSSFCSRNLPVGFDSAMPFFPIDRSLLELFGPTAKFAYSPPRPRRKKESGEQQGFKRGEYEVVRVMAQPFLRHLTCFRDLDGYIYPYLCTKIDLIAEFANARIPTENFAKALLENKDVVQRLFPGGAIHTDMLFRHVGSRCFSSIIKTKDDDTFRYPGGGLIWKHSSKGKHMIADHAHLDILQVLQFALVLVRVDNITRLR